MKRILAEILVLALLISCVNITAFADGADDDPDNGYFFVSYDAGEEGDEWTKAGIFFATASTASPSELAPGRVNQQEFTSGKELIFILDPPESRQGKTPMAEIIRMGSDNQEKTPLQTWADPAEENYLELTGDGENFRFTFKPTDEKWFKIVVRWSDYDCFGPEPGYAFLELAAGDGGRAEMDETGLEGDDCRHTYEREEPDGQGGTFGAGGLRANVINAEKNRTLFFYADEGWELSCIQLNEGDPILASELDYDNERNAYKYTIEAADWTEETVQEEPESWNYSHLSVFASFTEQQTDLQERIDAMDFLFGDWDGDSDVDEDDLKTGVQDMVYYPYFSGNEDARQKYGLTGAGDITVTVSPTGDTMLVTDRNYQDWTIPQYEFGFTLTQASSGEPEYYHGLGYLFDFGTQEVPSDYRDNSAELVIMETTFHNEQGHECSVGMMKNTHENQDRADLITGEAGSEAVEGGYILYAPYDVVYNAEDNKNERSVKIFGNGAGLDTLFSSDADTSFSLWQGRNEDLVRESGHGTQIFAQFYFLQEGTLCVQAKGREAAGSTPAWAYGSSPIASAAENAAEANEIEAYFGSAGFDIRPAVYGTGVDSITNIQPVGDVPDKALRIESYPAENRWSIEFLSDYYDSVTFRITLHKDDEETEDRFITLHRVGIDIKSGGTTEEERSFGYKTLMHGTTNGPDYWFETENPGYILYATYYYPEDGGTTEQVDLYATLTWKSGKVTRELIANSADLNLAWHYEEDNVQTSDFVLYEGKEENAPVRAEVIAVKTGSDAETFAGARFGAGRGVEWEK